MGLHDILIDDAKMSYEGEPADIKRLNNELKKPVLSEVNTVLSYLKEIGGKIDYKNQKIDLDCCGQYDWPHSVFKPLSFIFPNITFIFDLKGHGLRYGQLEYWRLFSIYKKGRLVYDAGNSVYLPDWLDKREDYEYIDVDELDEEELNELENKGFVTNDYYYLDNTPGAWDDLMAARDDLHGSGYEGYKEVEKENILDYIGCVNNALLTLEWDSTTFENDLKYFPEEYITEELCLEAVKKRFFALELVPKKFKTAKLCLIAVKESGTALKYVPKELKTAKLCHTAVKNSASALKYVPKELITDELCLTAIKFNVNGIGFVPKKFQTIELCLAAVKYNINAINFVPRKFQSQVKELLEKEKIKKKTSAKPKTKKQAAKDKNK